MCVDDKFSKSFKSSLGQDAIYNFINLLIQLKKVNIVVMWWKNILTKKLLITKEDDEDFKNST